MTLGAASPRLEARSGLDEVAKFANHDAARRTLQNAELMLNNESAVTNKAWRFPVSMVGALELAVGPKNRAPGGARVLHMILLVW